MTQELRNTYQRYVEINNQIKSLEAELVPLKRAIIEFHAGRPLVTEDGFISKIGHQSQMNFLKENLKTHFGGEIPAEFISHTEYDTLSVKMA